MDLGAFAQKAVNRTIETPFHKNAVHRLQAIRQWICRLVKQPQHRSPELRERAVLSAVLRLYLQRCHLCVGQVRAELQGERRCDRAHVNLAQIAALCHALAHHQEG